MAAPTVNAAKELQVNRGKSGRSVVKSILESPFGHSWPLLETGTFEHISEELKGKFSSLGDMSIGNKEKLTAGKPNDSEVCQRKEEIKSIRSHLALGLREVTRAMERGKLSLCLVDRSAKPPMLTTHLVPLSATRGCPAAAVPALGQLLAPCLGFGVIAIGFKRRENSGETPFDELVTNINLQIPDVTVPWLADLSDPDEYVEGNSPEESTIPVPEDNAISSTGNSVHKDQTIVIAVSSDRKESSSSRNPEALSDKKSDCVTYIYKDKSTVVPRTNVFSTPEFISFSNANSLQNSLSSDHGAISSLKRPYQIISNGLSFSNSIKSTKTSNVEKSSFVPANVRRVFPTPSSNKKKLKKKCKALREK